MTFDLVIENGTIITVNPEFEIIESGIIGIDKGRLTHVGVWPDHRDPAEAVETIDADGGLILPGLVNTHTHLPMTLFRGLADDLPLHHWLHHYIFPAESKHLTPETVRAGSLLACAEMLLSGTTTCCDGYFFEDEVARAVRKSGMRGVLGQGIVDFPAPDLSNPADNVDNARRYVERWKSSSGRIIPSIFCHSPYTCSADTLHQAKQVASDEGVLMQIHVAETRQEADNITAANGLSPVAYLDNLEILDRQTLAVHAVWVSASDQAILARRGTPVSHNPESNMKLAAGCAPLPELLAAGIELGLGTDGCASNNDLDLFGAMAMAARLHKAVTLDPTVVDAGTVLKMATIGGARAIGLSDRIGSLEPGKAADLIVVDTRQPHMTPMYNPVSQLVYAAKGSDVRDVLVAGRPLVRNGKLVRMDPLELMEKVRAIAQNIRT